MSTATHDQQEGDLANSAAADRTTSLQSSLPPRPTSSSSQASRHAAGGSSTQQLPISAHATKKVRGPRARFQVQDPERVCEQHVEACNKRIEMLERRIAEIEDLERNAVSPPPMVSDSRQRSSVAGFASAQGGASWAPKSAISTDEESRLVERLTRPKAVVELEEIHRGNRFRARQDEEETPIDELDDEERAARIQELVTRLADEDVSSRAAHREERLEREMPTAPAEQWKSVVETLREGRRRFHLILSGGGEEDEEEPAGNDDDEEDSFRLSAEKQEALAQRLCNESLQKKQEAVKSLTKKYYGDDVSRRKAGVLGDHYQATGMYLPFETGTIAAKTSRSPYRRYGSPSQGHVVVASSTTPLRHTRHSASSASSLSPIGRLPPLISPVVARRKQREKKAGVAERKPTPAELGKRLHDDSRTHHQETMKKLEERYLVNPLTQATQFGGSAGSTVVVKPIKFISTDEVKALADRLSQPITRGPK